MKIKKISSVFLLLITVTTKCYASDAPLGFVDTGFIDKSYLIQEIPKKESLGAKFNPYDSKYIKKLDAAEIILRNNAVSKSQLRNGYGWIGVLFGVAFLGLSTSFPEKEFSATRSTFVIGGLCEIALGIVCFSVKSPEEESFEIYMKNKVEEGKLSKGAPSGLPLFVFGVNF